MAIQKKTLVEVIEAYDAAESRSCAANSTMQDMNVFEMASQELRDHLASLPKETPTHRGWQYHLGNYAIEKTRVPRPAIEIDAENP